MSSRRALTVGLALAVLAATACTGTTSPRPTASGSLSVAAPGPSMTTVGDEPAGSTTSPEPNITDIAPEDVGFVVPAPLPREVARFVGGRGSRIGSSGEVTVGVGEPRHAVIAACLGYRGPVAARFEISREADTDGYDHAGAEDTSGAVECDGSIQRIEVSGLPLGPTGIELIDPRSQGVRGYAILVRLGEGAPR